MAYTEYIFTVVPPQPFTDILIARLSQIPFETFEETATGLKAYILTDEDDELFVKEQFEDLDTAQIAYEKNTIEKQNWNIDWESNFQPICIEDTCYIRADFHPTGKEDYAYEIIITPKMSFGTGHHETTSLMVSFLLELPLQGKKVLDMGTGTGILAILAKMRGAEEVTGIDIDEWSYENAVENAEKNQVAIQFKKGGAESIENTDYDLVLANINKNILKEDLSFYVHALKKGGTLVLSGLLEEDEEEMIAYAEEKGLVFEKIKKNNDWIALQFSLKD